MSPSPRSPQPSPNSKPANSKPANTRPPRKNWFVALTVGILRGIGALFTAIASWLEKRPSDPRPSVGVWGLAIALGVTVAIVTGRSSPELPPAVQVATDMTETLSPASEPVSTSEASPESSDDEVAFPAASEPDSEPDSEESLFSTDLETDIDMDREFDTFIDAETEPEEELEADSEAIAEPVESVESAEPEDIVSPAPAPIVTAERDFDADSDELDRERLPDVPEELTAPVPAIELEPAPPPLTPEQRLIAALQERIAAISEDYAADAIVTTVRVDFARNHLDVELDDRWYALEEAEQDRLATDLRDRGQQFDFYDVSLVDAAGQLLARPAAIGDGMVVVRRLS